MRQEAVKCLLVVSIFILHSMPIMTGKSDQTN
jgi:hypothetical protein